MLLPIVLLLFASDSSAAAPDTVKIYPEGGLWAPDTTWYVTDDVYMVSNRFRWTADRTGIHLVDDAGEFSTYWSYSTPYRVDRASGPPDTIVGRGDEAIIDLVDGTRPPLWDEPITPHVAMNDVDGDGTVDLWIGTWDLLLTSFDNPRIVTFPPDVLISRGGLSMPHPLPDLDGDGHAELLDPIPDHVTTGPYGPPISGSSLYLYDGNPDGYDDLARWLFHIESGLLDVVAVQADDDPELELLGLLTTDLTYSWADDAHTVLIDDVASDNPTVTLSPNRRGISGRAYPSFLTNLGDLDGDQRDDVLLAAAYHNEVEDAEYDCAILSSAYDWDITQPAAQFRIGVQEGNTYEHAVLAVDADQDGRMDLVAVRESSVPTIQAWFGPLYELPEPPEHTATTGDTGPTTDTAVSTPTADTAATTDSGTPDTTASAPKPGTPEASGCGCQAAADPRGMWPRRR